MKLSNKINFNLLVTKAQNHLIHVISVSKNKEDLFFNLAGFYGGLMKVLIENKFIEQERQDEIRENTDSMKEKLEELETVEN